MPECWIGYGEDEWSSTCACSSSFDVLRVWLVDSDFDRAAGIGTTVYRDVYCCILAPLG
jgi:hypothetical protein